MNFKETKVQEERETVRPDGRIIYCRYIVKDGRRIYPRRAKAFRFCLG